MNHSRRAARKDDRWAGNATCFMRADFAPAPLSCISRMRQTLHAKPTRLPLRIITTAGMTAAGLSVGRTSQVISGNVTRTCAGPAPLRDSASVLGNPQTAMAAKKKIPPPQPVLNRTWLQLTKAEQNSAYVSALHAYNKGDGPNPRTRGEFFRGRVAALQSNANA